MRSINSGSIFSSSSLCKSKLLGLAWILSSSLQNLPAWYNVGNGPKREMIRARRARREEEEEVERRGILCGG